MAGRELDDPVEDLTVVLVQALRGVAALALRALALSRPPHTSEAALLPALLNLVLFESCLRTTVN